MKKVLVAALAVALAAVMTVPAGAFENEFGGYWRTRAFTQKDFSASDKKSTPELDKEKLADGQRDISMVDTRTHIYYTAKFSEDLKLVNKFEMDAVWGDDANYGKIGADGTNFEIKNTYLDFNISGINVKLGAQDMEFGRAFVFSDDASGAVITGKFGNVEVPFYWIKGYEGGQGKDANDMDKDIYVIAPVFNVNSVKINPYFVYVSQEEGWYKAADSKANEEKSYDIGVDVDAEFEGGKVWFTAIYQGGEVTDVVSKKEKDRAAYLAAAGGNVEIGGIDIHGQMFYASGDDDAADGDAEAFEDITSGGSYYWSEIMGLGMFDSCNGIHDKDRSANSPADDPSNIIAFNIGASMSPMDKLSVGADLWYAAFNEDDENGETDLGTEIDLSASYEVMENLKLDVVAAYLFAGDATGEEDPMEIGAQLSLSF